SKPALGHRIYPYLLRGVEITDAGHVWSADATYLPLRRGFCYLTAVMDWTSRRVLSFSAQQRPGRLLLRRGSRGGPRALRRARGLEAPTRARNLSSTGRRNSVVWSSPE